MKRLNNKIDPVLQIHHIMEAYEDSFIELMKTNGVTPEEAFRVVTEGDTSLTDIQNKSIAAFSSVHVLHMAVHDIMETNDLSKIGDVTLRKVVRDHRPRFADEVTAEQLREYREDVLGL